jgi:Cu(I)/Ag(I) efflux system periplasmic protein CusF
MKKPLIKATASFGFAMLALNSYADQGSSGSMNMDNMKMDSMEKGGSKTIGMNEAIVKAVNKDKKSITLQHGPIKSKTVEMTPMTMSFPVQQESLLSNVKVGDKVDFNIENINNIATVTLLKVQK